MDTSSRSSSEQFSKSVVDFHFSLPQIHVGHQQLVLFEQLAVPGFDVIADGHPAVLIHDFLPFLRKQSLDKKLGREGARRLRGE